MRFPPSLIFAAAFGTLAAFVAAQTPRAPQDSIQKLRDAQRQLAADFSAVIAAHANDAPETRQQAMEVLHQQNQTRLAAMRAQAVAVASAKPVREMPMIRQIAIPGQASPALEELLVARARLRNETAALANRLRRIAPAEQRQAQDAWQVRLAPQFAAQQQLARQVAAQRGPRLPPPPPEPRLPSGASPEVRAFLADRQALVREQQAIDTRNLAPAERAQALRQWRENRTAPAPPAAHEARPTPDLSR